MRKTLTFLLLAATCYATNPPTLSQTNRGVELSPAVEGDGPLTYQWYRETGVLFKKRVALPPPEGIQQTLFLKSPYTSGTYFCEVKNAAGSVTSRPIKLSVTKSTTAPEMAVTIRQP